MPPTRVDRALLVAAIARGALPRAASPRRIGLVLGGGGARGGAHLGVLEVLEELRIPIDCIAGTSMGALVGGAYAAGVSPADIIDAGRRTDWISMFDDSAGRQSVNLRRKELDDRFYSAARVRRVARGPPLPRGRARGREAQALLQPAGALRPAATAPSRSCRCRSRSSPPTSAPASAWRSAAATSPRRCAPACRCRGSWRRCCARTASSSTAASPTTCRSPRCRALCNADVVIAVNVGSPLLKPEEVTGVVTVLGQVVNLLTEQNVAARARSSRRGDIYIQPDLGDITATEFTRQLDAAEHGRAATRAWRRAAELRATRSARDYAAWQTHVRLASPHAAARHRQGGDRRDALRESGHAAHAASAQKEGKPLDAAALAADLVAEYSQGDLHSLDYSVVRERDRTILRITPVEKPWGPDYLRFGLGLASDFRSESSYNLRALYPAHLDQLARRRVAPRRPDRQRAEPDTEFYQPFDRRHLTFVARPRQRGAAQGAALQRQRARGDLPRSRRIARASSAA